MPVSGDDTRSLTGIRCPSCGIMVSPGFNNCPSCGADLRAGGASFEDSMNPEEFVDDEGIEGGAPPAKVQRCPRCGDVVDDTMPRCRRCGLPFPTRAPPPEMAAPRPPPAYPDVAPEQFEEAPAAPQQEYEPAHPSPEAPPPPAETQAPPAPAPPARAPPARAPPAHAPPAPASAELSPGTGTGPPPQAAQGPGAPAPAAPPRAPFLSRPKGVPRAALKTLPPEDRRRLRENFMKQGAYILMGLGAADLVVWLVPLAWMNLIVNLAMCIANLGVIGVILARAQAHLGASSGELSAYERKMDGRVLLGLFIILIVPFHEVLGLYPLGYYGSSWTTYGSFVGMINPLIMLAGAFTVAYYTQQSRERLGYFAIWRNGALLLLLPPIFALMQLGLPILIYPEWFHATLGLIGGTVMGIAFILKNQRDKQFVELENAMKWGDEYVARGQLDRAVQQYDRAINMAHTLFSHLIFNPDSPYAQVRVPPAYSEPWFRKGRLLLRMKRPKKALAIFDMITEMDPNNQVALLNEAEILTQTGEHESALRAVDRVLAIVPDHPDALKLRATIVDAARTAAEQRELAEDAETAESVFGTAGPGAGDQGQGTATAPVPRDPGLLPEEGFETI